MHRPLLTRKAKRKDTRYPPMKSSSPKYLLGKKRNRKEKDCPKNDAYSEDPPHQPPSPLTRKFNQEKGEYSKEKREPY
jgi:hypothetical protein